jgi:O-antigen biosynthesis protein
MVEPDSPDASADDLPPSRRGPVRLAGGPTSWERELNDVRRELTRREREIARLDGRLTSLQAELSQIRSSTSWRMTAPLRWLSRSFRGKVVGFSRRALRVLYWVVTLQIAERLRERRLARRIRASGLLDAAFYASEYPDVPAGIDLALHYAAFGAAEGRDPNPAFSTLAYVAEHPEAAGKGRNPLVHYLETRHRGRTAPRPDWSSIAPATPALKAVVRAALQAAAAAADGIEPAPPVFPVSARPQVSIMVTAGEDRARLARCLHALGQYLGSVGVEMSVIAKPSPGIEDLSKAAGVRFIDPGAAPPSAWPNLAAREAKGAYLVFVDDGIVVLPGWLETLLDTFHRFPDAGAVGAYRLRGDGLGAMAGGIVHRDGGLGVREETAPLGHHDFASVREVDFCALSALAMPAEIWDLAGGTDEQFATADYRAADLALKLRAAGRRILCQPFSRVVSVAEKQETDVARGRDDRAKFLARWHGALGPGEALPEMSRAFRDRARPRALLIDRMTPAPDRDAGSVLVCGYMRILQQLGYEVTFASSYTLDHAGRYTDDLRRSGIICICAPFARSLASFVEQEAAGFDLVILWRAVVATQYLRLVRRAAPDARIVFHTVDLHYLREERQARLDGSQEMAAEAERTRIGELAAIGDADCTILVSGHEAAVIGSVMPDAKIRVIPLVVEIPGCLAPLEQRRDVVFIGGFRHQPNIDAVMFLASEVWPRVRRALPSARLIIIGADPPADIERLDDPEKGVEIRGWVEDLTQPLRSCRLTVAPLRFGAGVKGKIVTSLAHGVPCVATPVAVEGMGLKPGRHVLVAEQPSALAAAIVELYGNAQLWHALSEAGLDFARRHFSVDTVAAEIRAMLADLGLPAGESDAPRKVAPTVPAARPHRVSVVVPLYNHERYIEEALRSVLTQTMPAHEVIVVDDGSTDGSAGVVERIRERHPQILLWSKENGGAHSAINAGIQRATGDLVAILNSDDVYRPDRLAVMLRELDRAPEADAVVTGLGFIDGEGRAIRNSWYEEGIAFHRRTRDLALTLVNGNIFMTTSNLLARRALFQEIGGFSPLRYAHDLDFFLRLIVRGKSIRIAEQPLVSYRQHATNTIKESALKVKAEWAAAAAFFLHQLWGTGGAADWRRGREFLAVLDHHGLTAPVLLCMAYFRQHPSESLEQSPFHDDAAFRSLLADLVR